MLQTEVRLLNEKRDFIIAYIKNKVITSNKLKIYKESNDNFYNNNKDKDKIVFKFIDKLSPDTQIHLLIGELWGYLCHQSVLGIYASSKMLTEHCELQVKKENIYFLPFKGKEHLIPEIIDVLIIEFFRSSDHVMTRLSNGEYFSYTAFIYRKEERTGEKVLEATDFALDYQRTLQNRPEKIESLKQKTEILKGYIASGEYSNAIEELNNLSELLYSTIKNIEELCRKLRDTVDNPFNLCGDNEYKKILNILESSRDNVLVIKRIINSFIGDDETIYSLKNAWNTFQINFDKALDIIKRLRIEQNDAITRFFTVEGTKKTNIKYIYNETMQHPTETAFKFKDEILNLIFYNKNNFFSIYDMLEEHIIKEDEECIIEADEYIAEEDEYEKNLLEMRKYREFFNEKIEEYIKNNQNKSSLSLLNFFKYFYDKQINTYTELTNNSRLLRVGILNLYSGDDFLNPARSEEDASIDCIKTYNNCKYSIEKTGDSFHIPINSNKKMTVTNCVFSIV